MHGAGDARVQDAPDPKSQEPGWRRGARAALMHLRQWPVAL